jgi:hypothetical protein
MWAEPLASFNALARRRARDAHQSVGWVESSEPGWSLRNPPLALRLSRAALAVSNSQVRLPRPLARYSEVRSDCSASCCVASPSSIALDSRYLPAGPPPYRFARGAVLGSRLPLRFRATPPAISDTGQHRLLKHAHALRYASTQRGGGCASNWPQLCAHGGTRQSSTRSARSESRTPRHVLQSGNGASNSFHDMPDISRRAR